ISWPPVRRAISSCSRRAMRFLGTPGSSYRGWVRRARSEPTHPGLGQGCPAEDELQNPAFYTKTPFCTLFDHSRRPASACRCPGPRGKEYACGCPRHETTMSLASLLLVIAAAIAHASWNLIAKRAAQVGPAFVFAYGLCATLLYTPWVAWIV